MSAVSTRIMRSAEERYRTLLDAPSAVADQPTIQAVLHSLRDVLSSTCEIHGAHLYILDGGEKVCTCWGSIEKRTHPRSRLVPKFRALVRRRK